MADIKNTPGGEHIEELLSQLKSIFGNLSESEDQEAKQKIGPPPVSPASTPTPPIPPTEEPPPPLTFSEPESAAPVHQFEMPAPQMEEVGLELPAPPNLPESPPDPEPVTPPAVLNVTPVDSFVPSEVVAPTGASILPTAIFFPEGKVAEAKIVAEKVERITPKFTRVNFVLNVQMLNSYNQRIDWREAILKQLQGSPIKAVLMMLDKSMEESRRKALQAALEPRGIYVQEVLISQIEKKALYTDMLLGLVFFFDSQKPAPPEAAA